MDELEELNELRIKIKELHDYLYDCNMDFAKTKLREINEKFKV